jgi:hypothetical protein
MLLLGTARWLHGQGNLGILAWVRQPRNSETPGYTVTFRVALNDDTELPWHFSSLRFFFGRLLWGIAPAMCDF